MKITAVRPFLLSYVFPDPILLNFYGGRRTIYKRDAMLIRVEADNGLTGYAPGQGSEKACNAITRWVAPFLEGKNLAEPDALRILFMQTAGFDPGVIKAYSAVEVALYDLLGKALDVPVSELLGGRVRDRIRLYGSAGMYMPPEKYAEEAAAIAELGFPAYKMRSASGPEEDLRTVQLMREATGPAVDLMVDAHAWWRMGDRSYSFETVQELAKGMSEYGIAWLEEPLLPDDHEAYANLKRQDLAPLATGEHERSDEGFFDLIDNHSVDYVQMDLCCQGGYRSATAILTEASREGVRFAFHSWGTALEIIAAAQIGICWPESVAEWLEYPCYSAPGRPGMYPFPLAEEILDSPLDVQHGELRVPAKPGLGVEVNEAVIEKYPWAPGPWSRFELECPHEIWDITADHSLKWQPPE